MVERTNHQRVDLGTLHYEITDRNQVVIHIKLLQSNQLFRAQRAKMQKHLCLIIDDSGSMGMDYAIDQVKEHCAKFGEKFFDENGKKLTLIKFGTDAEKTTFLKEADFQ